MEGRSANFIPPIERSEGLNLSNICLVSGDLNPDTVYGKMPPDIVSGNESYHAEYFRRSREEKNPFVNTAMVGSFFFTLQGAFALPQVELSFVPKPYDSKVLTEPFMLTVMQEMWRGMLPVLHELKGKGGIILRTEWCGDTTSTACTRATFVKESGLSSVNEIDKFSYVAPVRSMMIDIRHAVESAFGYLNTGLRVAATTNKKPFIYMEEVFKQYPTLRSDFQRVALPVSPIVERGGKLVFARSYYKEMIESALESNEDGQK